MAARRAAGSQALDAVDARTTDESLELAQIFREAVREARERNRRLGISNVQVDDERRLTEELRDGSVRLLKGK
jgi:Ni,Fe-hydrogenase III component G